MKHTIRHEETNVEKWVYDEVDVINAMYEKSGIPPVSIDGHSTTTWDISVSQYGIKSITIQKTMTTTDGEKVVPE